MAVKASRGSLGNRLVREERFKQYIPSKGEEERKGSLQSAGGRRVEVATVLQPSICKWRKMALECTEQFPQVHSLAAVSIIDSQPCHKKTPTLPLALGGGGGGGGREGSRWGFATEQLQS